MKKIIFLFLTGFISFYSQAQINVSNINKLDQGTSNGGDSTQIGRNGNPNMGVNVKLEIAKKNAMYNGAIIGYAKACKLNESDAKKIELLLFKNFNAVDLSRSQIDELRGVFNDSVENAVRKGANHSQNECALFKTEFEKIVNSMNSNSVN